MSEAMSAMPHARGAGAVSVQDELARAIAAANGAAAAFGMWSALAPETRADHLRAMADALRAAAGDLIALAAQELGAAPAWTNFNLDLAVGTLLASADLAPLLRQSPETIGAHGERSVIVRQAAGVVLGIAPWNAPITLGVRAIAGPLICGNTVVMKASEHCPRTHSHLVDVLNASGLPPGVLGVVTNLPDHSAEVVSALIAHPAVRRINFTGSTRVGRDVAIEAARHLKRCVLELSGKAPMIVLEDADLDAAVEATCFGAYFNQGQICMSTERVIVVGSVADAFVVKLVARVGAITAADPVRAAATLGRMINADAVLRVRGLIDDAIAKGARLLIGGGVDGAVMQAAVVDGVSSNMRLFHEESFGPVASVMRVFDADEALSVANDSEFGLSASIFSRDVARARALADKLECGMVQINGPTVFDDPGMPVGGMKSSGYGRVGGATPIEEFTEMRWIASHDTGRNPTL